MLQDIKDTTSRLKIVVIRCKNCGQIVKKNSLHDCVVAGTVLRVRMGAYVPDNFCRDRGIARD